MPYLTSDDFGEVDTHEKLSDPLSTGFGLSGQPGTREHAEDTIVALSHVSDDIFRDYGSYVDDNGFAATAASHANISRLQAGAAYAQEVLTVLASNPDLMALVQAELDKKAARSHQIP
jgi:hypothetical protein